MHIELVHNLSPKHRRRVPRIEQVVVKFNSVGRLPNRLSEQSVGNLTMIRAAEIKVQHVCFQSSPRSFLHLTASSSLWPSRIGEMVE
jgi:hypothetical protein